MATTRRISHLAAQGNWRRGGVADADGRKVCEGGACRRVRCAAAWEIAGIGDLDADGRADLLWRETETGDLAAWLMSGATVKQSSVIAPGVPLTWQIQ